MLDMNRDRDWLVARAKEEGDGFFCVGGLVRSLGRADHSGRSQHTTRLAFGKLVNLRRRTLRMTTERFADVADIDVAELLDIESGDGPILEPRTVHQLAKTLSLPERKLMQLSGLAEARDETISKAAVRFAARSESIKNLTGEEQEALEEFVKFLAEA